MSKNSSLKIIAAKAGVSTTTVHRALTGKKDCSAAMREKILSIASEEGYEFNYYAASLRRKKLTIGIITISGDPFSHFFVDKMHDGVRRCEEENSCFNIDYKLIDFATAPGSKLKEQMSKVKNAHYDGILMHILNSSDKNLGFINNLVSDDIPVVAIEINPTDREDVCTVGTDNCTAGRMAGELISKFTHSAGKVLIFSQEMHTKDVNAEEARAEILSRRKDLSVEEIKLPLTGDESTLKTVKNSIKNRPVAVYATCARHTRFVMEALGKVKRVETVIGSELFDESRNALESGLIDAVIDKRPEIMGYRALDYLLSALLKKEDIGRSHLIEPRLILKANCNSSDN